MLTFLGCGSHDPARSRFSQVPQAAVADAAGRLPGGNPAICPAPTSTSRSTMVRRPAQSWAMKLPSAAQELIASMSGTANSSSVILSISSAPGEIFAVVRRRTRSSRCRRSRRNTSAPAPRSPCRRRAAAPPKRLPLPARSLNRRRTKAASAGSDSKRGALLALPARLFQRQEGLKGLRGPLQAFCR